MSGLNPDVTLFLSAPCNSETAVATIHFCHSHPPDPHTIIIINVFIIINITIIIPILLILILFVIIIPSSTVNIIKVFNTIYITSALHFLVILIIFIIVMVVVIKIRNIRVGI